jgi:hypothetical protein
VTVLGVEPLDGFDQADVALLDQILQRHPRAAVLDGHRYDQPQVLLYERPAGEPVLGDDPPAEI